MSAWVFFIASTVPIVQGGNDDGGYDPNWGRVGSQGIVALERDQTRKYRPDIAAGTAGNVLGLDDQSIFSGFAATIFGCICAMVILIFTKKGREFANSVPILRPLGIIGEKISREKKDDSASTSVETELSEGPPIEDGVEAKDG